MRVVVKRVSTAKVAVSNEVVGKIGVGLLVLLGILHDDDNKCADHLIDKIFN